MITLLLLLLAAYASGIVLPLCLPGRPRAQVLAGSVCAIAGGVLGVGLGLAGLTASTPFTASLPSSIPLLAFTVRVDPLAAFFLLTISLAGLATSIYAIGYLMHFHGRVSLAALSSLYNGFLLSMTPTTGFSFSSSGS